MHVLAHEAVTTLTRVNAGLRWRSRTASRVAEERLPDIGWIRRSRVDSAPPHSSSRW